MTQHFGENDFSDAHAVMPEKRRAGQRAYLAGAAAEMGAVTSYQDQGCTVLENRWLGKSGEIDLILRDGNTVVFAEVKKARTFDQAIQRLRPQQMRRIHGAASEYLSETEDGQLSDVRFDLVVADAMGRIQIMENAFSHF